MKLVRWTLLCVVCLLLVSTPSAAPVSAHGYLVRAIPPDRAELQRPPARLQYWFSEDLEPRFSTITLRDASGQVLATGGVSENDEALLTMRVPPNLPDGAYIAELRTAFAGDGHVVAESRVFFVGQAAGELAGTAASSAAVAFEVVWRVVVYASMLLLLGTFAVYNLALVPAWGSKEHRAGLLPPRVMSRLNWLVAAALAFALIGNLLALLQQSMAFFGVGAGEVVAQGLWQIVRIGSRFGDVWNARMVLLALIAGLHVAGLYLRKDQPESLRPFWAANLWGAALLVGTFSVSSHASGSLLSPWAAIIVDYLHTLAVGIWAGGLAALVLVLPTALAPLSSEPRRLALLAAMKRFSRIAMVGVVVVVATGIYSASNWLYSPADVVTPYGVALLVKLLLVGGLLLVGMGHFAALNPARFERLSGVIEWMRAAGFVKTLRLEVLFALLALVTTSLLTATPVPEPEFLTANRALAAPHETQTVGGLDVTLTLSPGGPGLNTYDVLLTRDGAIVDGAETRLQFANPARDRRGQWHDAESAGDGLYVAAGDEIDRAGLWWALVDVVDGETATRAAFEWDISADAALRQTRDFTPIHALALLGVVGAAGFAMFPLWQRFNRAAQWNTTNVAVSVSAVVATGIMVTITTAGLSAIRVQYDDGLSSPPQIVNPTLPDADSLQRGRALYDEHCAAWSAADVERDFALLLERIPRIRDEELYTITQAGWQRLAPCTEPLSDLERWDIVNYLRVLSTEF